MNKNIFRNALAMTGLVVFGSSAASSLPAADGATDTVMPLGAESQVQGRPDDSGQLDFVPVMAQSCGMAKSKWQNSKNSMRAAFLQNPPKSPVYDALAVLNRDFEQVLRDLEHLEKLRLFRHRWQREFLKPWRATIEEIRAWVSFEVLEILHQKEEREWTRFGRIRQRAEEPPEPAVPVPNKAGTPKSHPESDAFQSSRQSGRNAREGIWA